MKKFIVPFSAILFLLASPAFAMRSHHHHGQNPPPPPVATSTPPVVSPSTFQFGFYQPPAGVPSSLTMEFTDAAFPSASGNLVIFLEPPYTDSQILAGQFDSQLKTFATATKSHSNIVLVLGEEDNCISNSDPWIVGVDGNTVASSIATIQHESSVARATDPNIKIAQSWNSDDCCGSTPLASYYAGSAYVDAIGIDGFS